MPQLAIYRRQDNLRCTYSHDYGEVVSLEAPEPRQESHGIFKPYGEKSRIVMNLKSLVNAGDWVDFVGHGWGIVENINPKPEVESSHDIFKLVGLTSAGVCKIFDYRCNTTRLLLPQEKTGSNRYLNFDYEEGLGYRTLTLQQIFVPEGGPSEYCDLETQETVRITVCPRTSEMWSNLAEVNRRLSLTHISAIP